MLALPVAAEDLGAIERARQLFPPDVTRALLGGDIAAPAGFDEAISKQIGADHWKALRARKEAVSGRDNDAAALCLVRLGIAPKDLRAGQVAVTRVRSEYPAAEGKTSGSFRMGQGADLVLSAIGFNRTGGPLLFNHPMGIASDGTRLLLADTYNNRILIWSSLPDGNTRPDLVLGQASFDTNDSGSGRDRLNFPVNVATDGTRILVADTVNDRILIWNGFPDRSGAPADLVLQGGKHDRGIEASGKDNFHWPWGVWTDGERVAVSSTRGGWVLIWNRFPEKDDQPADLVLRGGGKLGTPRTITSDGKRLIVGDHNPRMGSDRGGTFFWNTFPTRDDQPFDFFREDNGMWLRGCFTPDGKAVLIGETLHVWDAPPRDANTAPDLTITGYDVHAGDHTGVAFARGRLYVVCGNKNLIAVYRSVPSRADQAPDFAIGSADLETNTLETNFIISNPVPASNGKSLFVASDFDRRLYVWKRLPDRSGAHPDLVYRLAVGPSAIAVRDSALVLAGHKTVYIWKTLPLDGELPNDIFEQGIGSVRFRKLAGVALDDRYFYLSDLEANKIYVWEGIPSESSEPAFVLDVEQPWKISSDGEYLAVGTGFRHVALLYAIKDLGSGSRPAVVGSEPARPGRKEPPGRQIFNGVSSAVTWKGSLFVADTGWSRVHVWRDVRAALAGKRADLLLGEDDWDDVRAETGRNKLYWPVALSFDGSYLWVGEAKFSERVLRFSPTR